MTILHPILLPEAAIFFDFFGVFILNSWLSILFFCFWCGFAIRILTCHSSGRNSSENLFL